MRWFLQGGLVQSEAEESDEAGRGARHRAGRWERCNTILRAREEGPDGGFGMAQDRT